MSNPTIISWCPGGECDPCGCVLIAAVQTGYTRLGDTITITFGIPDSISGDALCSPSGQMNIPDGYTLGSIPAGFSDLPVITVTGPGLSGTNSGGARSVTLSVPDPQISLGSTFTIVITSSTGFYMDYGIPPLHEYRYTP